MVGVGRTGTLYTRSFLHNSASESPALSVVAVLVSARELGSPPALEPHAGQETFDLVLHPHLGLRKGLSPRLLQVANLGVVLQLWTRAWRSRKRSRDCWQSIRVRRALARRNSPRYQYVAVVVGARVVRMPHFPPISDPVEGPPRAV